MRELKPWEHQSCSATKETVLCVCVCVFAKLDESPAYKCLFVL